MAFAAFIKMPGVTGESTDDQHDGWMGVLSFREGMRSTASPGGSGASSDVQVEDFSFTKYIDLGTPTLRYGCCTRNVYDEVTFEVCQAGGDKHKYLEIKMSDVLIAAVESHGTCSQADGLPSEEVTLRFAKIEWTYSPVSASGGVTMAQWDVAQAG